jgi:hypothetical protein
MAYWWHAKPLVVRSHEILTYDLLAIGIDMGPDNIVPL